VSTTGRRSACGPAAADGTGVAPSRSAGLLLYRRNGTGVEVLLGHMGGPYFAKRDDGAWSIPKGEYADDEAPLAAARREFAEELGSPSPSGPVLELGSVRQRNGKVVAAWAIEADLDVTTVVSNTFEIEWPPRSGRRQSFPEIDRAEWFDLHTAGRKMIVGQNVLLDRLAELLPPS
jgi:predicted NUDIX family NTP pyrophosphohydrolase